MMSMGFILLICTGVLVLVAVVALLAIFLMRKDH